MHDLIDNSIARIRPSGIRVVFEKILELQSLGKEITRLDVGSPNFQAPEFIVKAAADNLQNGLYQYSSNWGLLSLRQALSERYASRANIAFDPVNEVIITNGSSEAVAMVLRTLLNGDDHFLIPTPTWPHYIADCQIFGKPYREIQTGIETGFKLTPEALTAAIESGTRALLLNSPGNPTGHVYTKQEFKAIYDICVQNDIMLILDEIYEDINFEFNDTLLSSGIDKQNIIYINGFSKNFGMTGFRVGFVMAAEPIARELLKYHQFTAVCGQAFVQQACADFLARTDQVEAFRDYVHGFLKPPQEVIDAIFQSGQIPMSKPSGAFYSFMRIPDAFADATTFCTQLLEDKLISSVPGDAFGSGYDRFFRVSYGSVNGEDVHRAMEEISGYY